ncbi:MAG: hypothetical protein ACOC95_04130 [Planctomycetota bacterium]
MHGARDTPPNSPPAWRPGLDLFVVYPGAGRIHLEHTHSAEGVKVDLAVFPETALRRDVRTEGYKFWMLSRAEIVHDPHGLARRNQELVLSWFRHHRQIDRAWQQQLARVRLHKADRTYQLIHWTWDDFVHHIEARFARTLCDPQTDERLKPPEPNLGQ